MAKKKSGKVGNKGKAKAGNLNKKGNKGEQSEAPKRDVALQAAINRTQQLIEGLSIPSRPNVLMDAVNVQNAFGPDLVKVSDVVSRDVALASRTLAEANARLPGLERQVASINQAVMLLGLERVREIVTELFLSTALISKDGRLQELRQRSVRTAQAAAWVTGKLAGLSPAFKSGYLKAIDGEEAYLLGLFHDCGLTILMQKFTDYQAFYDEVMASEGALADSETLRYQTNHGLVGYVLCDSWGMPESFCEAVLTHHDITGFTAAGGLRGDSAVLGLRAVLATAEWLSGEVAPQEWRAMRPAIVQFLGLNDAELDALYVEATAAGLTAQSTD